MCFLWAGLEEKRIQILSNCSNLLQKRLDIPVNRFDTSLETILKSTFASASSQDLCLQNQVICLEGVCNFLCFFSSFGNTKVGHLNASFLQQGVADMFMDIKVALLLLLWVPFITGNAKSLQNTYNII